MGRWRPRMMLAALTARRPSGTPVASMRYHLGCTVSFLARNVFMRKRGQELRSKSALSTPLFAIAQSTATPAEKTSENALPPPYSDAPFFLFSAAHPFRSCKRQRVESHRLLPP